MSCRLNADNDFVTRTYDVEILGPRGGMLINSSDACCHPTSGSLAVSYSGSKSGTATINLGTCGSATR